MLSLQHASGRRITTQRVNPSLTREEQAEVMHIQERVIELFGNRDAASRAGDRARADALQGEIDGLLRERDDIKMWAGAPAK